MEWFQKKKSIDKLTYFIFLLNLQGQFNKEEPASYAEEGFSSSADTVLEFRMLKDSKYEGNSAKKGWEGMLYKISVSEPDLNKQLKA